MFQSNKDGGGIMGCVSRMRDTLSQTRVSSCSPSSMAEFGFFLIVLSIGVAIAVDAIKNYHE